ncbi:HPr kinase/phosphorylase [Camelimonas abortus]
MNPPAASQPPPPVEKAVAIHATCIVVGECGVLFLGESGAGKTSLALEVLEACAAAGRFARLVADDRTLLRVAGGRILAGPHPAIAGRHELRGAGVRQAAHEPLARLRLVVRCQQAPAPRYPEAQEPWTFQGVALPAVVAGGAERRSRLVLAAIEDIINA